MSDSLLSSGALVCFLELTINSINRPVNSGMSKKPHRDAHVYSSFMNDFLYLTCTLDYYRSCDFTSLTELYSCIIIHVCVCVCVGV